MDFSKFTKMDGQKQLIVLGVMIVIAIVFIAVIAMTMMAPKPPPEPPEPPGPVYEVTLGDFEFKLEKAKDRGNILEVSELERKISNPKAASTTEKYIEVTIGTRNVGTESIRAGRWDVKEIVDSAGREFNYSKSLVPWISMDNNCGGELKPGFSPTLCTRIYEVAKIATGLQVKVESDDGSDFIDLGI